MLKRLGYFQMFLDSPQAAAMKREGSVRKMRLVMSCTHVAVFEGCSTGWAGGPLRIVFVSFVLFYFVGLLFLGLFLQKRFGLFTCPFHAFLSPIVF